MTIREQLQSIVSNQYQSEEGEIFCIELLKGMTESEISDFKSNLPCNRLPEDIE